MIVQCNYCKRKLDIYKSVQWQGKCSNCKNNLKTVKDLIKELLELDQNKYVFIGIEPMAPVIKEEKGIIILDYN